MKDISNETFNQAYFNQDNVALIKSVTNRYSKSLNRDVLYSCGLQGLWKCLRSHEYNHSSGQKFTTSLWRFVNWECQRELRKKMKQGNIITEADIEHDIEVTSPIPNPDIEHMKECLTLLPLQYRTLIQEYYLENRTMEEIGKLHNYSKEAARQKINRAVQRLQEIYFKK
jgi:RNA polymerase sigma factor (sigma-70 family)